MDDTARLKALRHYHILDTEPEQAFDDLTLLASHFAVSDRADYARRRASPMAQVPRRYYGR